MSKILRRYSCPNNERRNSSIIKSTECTVIDDVNVTDMEHFKYFFEDLTNLYDYGKEIYESMKVNLERINKYDKLKTKLECVREQLMDYINELEAVSDYSVIDAEAILKYTTKQEHIKQVEINNKVLNEERIILWDELSKIPLPEQFIRDHEDDVNWLLISKHQVLPIQFLKDFMYKVYWESISSREYITDEYVRVFKDELYWPILNKHNKISDDIKTEYSYKTCTFI